MEFKKIFKNNHQTQEISKKQSKKAAKFDRTVKKETIKNIKTINNWTQSNCQKLNRTVKKFKNVSHSELLNLTVLSKKAIKLEKNWRKTMEF